MAIKPHSTLTSLFTDIADAIREKDGTSTLKVADEFPAAIRAIPTGGGSAQPQKDVNFIDYDGTILHSYTAAEFAALSAMPANPDHSSDITWGGETIALTSQGWNYTLAKAQAYVAKYGKLWIGQMYIPTDGKTYVCIRLQEGRKSPRLGICPNGTVDVDWGDGTTHNTLTGSDLETVEWTPTHNYSAAGDYVIKLDVTSGTAQLYGDGDWGSAYLLQYASMEDGRNLGYQNSIQSVFIGNSTSIGANAFSYCNSLNAITIPDSMISIGDYAFGDCTALNAITIPDSMTSIGDYAFGGCTALNAITIPDSMTSIGANAFSYCNSLNAITIPDSVTGIEDYAFRGCDSLNAITIPDSVTYIAPGAFDRCWSLNAITIPDSMISIGYGAFDDCYFLSSVTFESVTPTDIVNSGTWKDIPTDCIIYVPATSLETYKAAENYPDPTIYTYIGY